MTCALWNSQYIDYCLKLSMEWIERPKFINGTVNKLPFPDLPDNLKKELKEIAIRQFYRVKTVSQGDEKSINFSSFDFFDRPGISIAEEYIVKRNEIQDIKKDYLQDLDQLNELVYSQFNVSTKERKDINEITSKAGKSTEGRFSIQ